MLNLVFMRTRALTNGFPFALLETIPIKGKSEKQMIEGGKREGGKREFSAFTGSCRLASSRT